jgi:hypothetical protein
VYIYLSSSWKNRGRVRWLAQQLRKGGHDVYDFTDPAYRTTPEIPPERFPTEFDPQNGVYSEYIQSVAAWKEAVNGNMSVLQRCDLVVLMLPCGMDAHADAYYALGRGKRLVICGQPVAGTRAPVHLWAEAILDVDEDVLQLLH